MIKLLSVILKKSESLEALFHQQRDQLKNCLTEVIKAREEDSRFWNLVVLSSSSGILFTGLIPIVVNYSKIPDSYVYCVLMLLPAVLIIDVLLLISIESGEEILKNLDAYLIKHEL